MVCEFTAEFWNSSDYAAYKQIRPLMLVQSANNLKGGANITTAGQSNTLIANAFVSAASDKGSIVTASGGSTVTLGINHPELNALGVKSVVNLKIGATIDRGGGLWEARLDFMEWRKPVPAKKQPTQNIPAQKAAPPIASNATQAENIGMGASIQARLRAQ